MSIPSEEILSFLKNPASYSHQPENVELIQTHISFVAIAPPYVYKVKKPVKLGFLDFSTLEKRHHYCREELRLNRRLCAHVYEEILPICRSKEGLTFGEGQEVVEYAVKMKQLAGQYFLDSMLQDGRVLYPDIDRVVDVLVAFYKSQDPEESLSSWGRIDRIKFSTDENFEQVQPFVDDLISSSVFEAIRTYTERFYNQHQGLFERRVTEGRILDCHGDLHLDHVHLSPARVCIYDCIEFNERFRHIDVASDIAFLAMDLDHKGFPHFSQYLCRRFADELTDPELLTLLPFYQCYRAFVRGKVAAIKSKEEEVDAASRNNARYEARSFFQLALRYALKGTKPMVVVMMGRVGTGKSTQARLLAEATGWPLVSSDATRKELAGVSIYKRGSLTERKKLYSPAQTERTYKTLFERAKAHADQGQNVIVDATFSRSEHRDAFRRAVWQESQCCFIEITAPVEVIKSRLAERENAVDVVSDARLEDFQALDVRFEDMDPAEDERIHFVSSDAPVQETAFNVLSKLISLKY